MAMLRRLIPIKKLGINKQHNAPFSHKKIESEVDQDR